MLRLSSLTLKYFCYYYLFVIFFVATKVGHKQLAHNFFEIKVTEIYLCKYIITYLC